MNWIKSILLKMAYHYLQLNLITYSTKDSSRSLTIPIITKTMKSLVNISTVLGNAIRSGDIDKAQGILKSFRDDIDYLTEVSDDLTLCYICTGTVAAIDILSNTGAGNGHEKSRFQYFVLLSDNSRINIVLDEPVLFMGDSVEFLVRRVGVE